MSDLKEWLRAEPQRFPLVVMMLSIFGFVWVIGDAVAGFGLPAAGMIFFLLIVLSFLYGRDLQ